MSRYRFAELRRNWNRNAKPEHKIVDASGYTALKEEARQRHAETGCRRIEMRAYECKHGYAMTFDF